jgi:cytochrome c
VWEDAKIKLGPPLNGLDGRKAGSVAGFNYSDANKASGITWGKDAFMKYIDNPAATVPGTRMAFGGIKDPGEVANLWAYVDQFKADGAKK